MAGEIERFGPTIAQLTPRVPQLLRGVERDNMAKEVDRFVEQGLPRDLATRIGEMLTAFLLLDVVEITRKSGRPADEVAEVHFTVSEQFSVDELLTKITELPRDDRWSALARAALRHDVYAALSAITSSVLASTEPREAGHRASGGLGETERPARRSGAVDHRRRTAARPGGSRDAVGGLASNAQPCGLADTSALGSFGGQRA